MAAAQRTVHGRRAARVVALQTLFEVDSSGHQPEEVLERRITDDGLGQDAAEFARELVAGVVRHLDGIDDLIQKAAPAWPFAQMARIDRNIIRIALYETLFRPDRLPFKVAVNEAVELAKSFGSDSSSRFVNGVVGRIVSEQMAQSEDNQSEKDGPIE